MELLPGSGVKVHPNKSNKLLVNRKTFAEFLVIKCYFISPKHCEN